MPARTPTDIGHTAITDHRILRRNDTVPQTADSKPANLAAWREPPPEFRQRDLGMAYLEVASQHKLEAMAQAGIKLLATLPASRQNEDAEVLSRLGMAAVPALTAAIDDDDVRIVALALDILCDIGWMSDFEPAVRALTHASPVNRIFSFGR